MNHVVDPADWKPLPLGLSAYEDGVQTSISRLDILFGRDPFVAMLELRLRNQIVVVLAERGAVWQPQTTRTILMRTPYALLWSDAFINHIESLVWIASGREVK